MSLILVRKVLIILEKKIKRISLILDFSFWVNLIFFLIKINKLRKDHVNIIYHFSYRRLIFIFIFLLSLYLSLYLQIRLRIFIWNDLSLIHVTIIVTVFRPIVVFITLFTIASSILYPTNVTKLIATSACHMTTSFILLYPKSTFRTLLVFGTFCKLDKLFIFLSHLSTLFILFTCLSCMRFSLTT